jgi:peptide chain release factor 2
MILLALLQSSTSKYADLAKIIVPSLDEAKKRIGEIDASPGEVWGDRSTSVSLTKERTRLVELVEKMGRWSKGITDDIEMVEAFGEEAVIGELLGAAEKRMKEMEGFEITCLMKREYDECDCILQITAGSGGFDACEFAARMLRMYLRWAANNGYKAEMLDEKWSDEHSSKCLDTASIRIFGKPYAMGFLRGETGVHRVIRCSEFNAAGLRQTSFVAVLVLPDLDDTIEVEIDEGQLEITGTFAGGAGGQSVNRTKSACRLKYEPAGINIVVRMERSFHDNKRFALKMLKAKLIQIEIDKKNAARDQINDNLATAAFGGANNRTYYYDPAALVKDHRSKHETRNIEALMDGELQPFLEANLRAQ